MTPWGPLLSAHFRRNSDRYWVPIFFTALVGALYYPVLSGRVGFGWDTTETYWPDLAYFARELGRGEWPLWNPYDRGGFPFFADPQPSLWYPVQWVLASIGAALGETPWWLIQSKMLGHHVLAGVLMFAFLRTRKLARIAALIGGSIWVCSTPWLIHKASNVLLPMAWIPLLWIAIDALVEKPSVRRGLALAAVLYLPGSAGSPPGFFYTLLAAASYGAFRAVAASLAWHRDGALRANSLRLLLGLCVAAVTTLALQLIIVMPGLELAAYTPRGERGMAYALSFPLPAKSTVLGWLSPAVGKVDAFMGTAALFLSVSALVLSGKRDRGVVWMWAALSVLFLLLAMGPATPLLSWAVEHVPGFGLFRASNRYKLLHAVTTAALAGVGADALTHCGREQVRRVCIAVAIPLAAILILVATMPTAAQASSPRAVSIVCALLVAAACVAAALRPTRTANLTLLALVPIIFFEPGHFWHTRGKIMEAKPPSKTLRDVVSAPEAGQSLRIYDEYQLEQRAGSRLGVRDFRGYPSGDPLDFVRYQDVLRFAGSKPAILAEFNVGYVLTGSHHRNGRQTHRIKRPPMAPQFQRQGNVLVANHPAPQVACYYGVRSAEQESVLPTMLERGTERRYAVMEPAEIARGGEAISPILENLAAPPSTAGQVIEFAADRVVTEVTCSEPGLVVLNEVYYPGWQATINGAPANVLTADYLLRAVVAKDAGAVRIVWSFHPKKLGWLLPLWWTGVLALVIGALWPMRAKLTRWRQARAKS